MHGCPWMNNLHSTRWPGDEVVDVPVLVQLPGLDGAGPEHDLACGGEDRRWGWCPPQPVLDPRHDAHVEEVGPGGRDEAPGLRLVAAASERPPPRFPRAELDRRGLGRLLPPRPGRAARDGVLEVRIDVARQRDLGWRAKWWTVKIRVKSRLEPQHFMLKLHLQIWWNIYKYG